MVELYFEHANPQIPILHRGDFMTMFARAYATDEQLPRELDFLNILFAIGAGIMRRQATDRLHMVDRAEAGRTSRAKAARGVRFHRDATSGIYPRGDAGA